MTVWRRSRRSASTSAGVQMVRRCRCPRGIRDTVSRTHQDGQVGSRPASPSAPSPIVEPEAAGAGIPPPPPQYFHSPCGGIRQSSVRSRILIVKRDIYLFITLLESFHASTGYTFPAHPLIREGVAWKCGSIRLRSDFANDSGILDRSDTTTRAVVPPWQYSVLGVLQACESVGEIFGSSS